MRTDDFSFELPPELIAAYPSPERTGSRLLVVNRADGSLTHARFPDLPNFLRPDDLLVLNDSRVIPASLETEDGTLSLLLVEETSPRHWTALVKPAKRALPGMRLRFRSRQPGAPPLEAEVLKTLESGERVLRFFGEIDFEAFGDMPIPPYILKRRKALALDLNAPAPTGIDDRERYQTVYANELGSVAAPTAGLHFTPELLARFDHAFVTLHVGLGTFRPVKVERLEDHIMHRETYSIPPGLKERAANPAGRRIVAVGTTSARVLESAPSLKPQQGSTDIFIHPPYEFRRVGALLTNFHLPKSTLLMLVSAFASPELIEAAYREAVEKRYRFFSYGDAMLIL